VGSSGIQDDVALRLRRPQRFLRNLARALAWAAQFWQARGGSVTCACLNSSATAGGPRRMDTAERFGAGLMALLGYQTNPNVDVDLR